MNVLVIEQEKLAAQKIKDILNGIDESIKVVGVTEDVYEAVDWLNRNDIPDIILANNTTIIDLEKKAERDIKATVILSRGAEHLNLRAFRYKTMRHFLPGFDDNENFETLISSPKDPNINSASYKERFLVKQGQRLLSIHVNQIAYFFSEERFIFFRTFDNQKFLLEYRIEQLEKLLLPSHFFRINRSYIISIPTVKEIHAYFGNRLKIYLLPAADKEVIVSRKRVTAFKSWLGK
ncbi:MAG: LytTR family transcriptional regulator DNA-binding domain-containing protein [Chitinophagaceae bacterium]